MEIILAPLAEANIHDLLNLCSWGFSQSAAARKMALQDWLIYKCQPIVSSSIVWTSKAAFFFQVF